nr:MAG TPA: hypothetical protein [Caudoviricetes sp.]
MLLYHIMIDMSSIIFIYNSLRKKRSKRKKQCISKY